MTTAEQARIDETISDLFASDWHEDVFLEEPNPVTLFTVSRDAVDDVTIDDLTIDDLSSSLGQQRTARKPWRCTCAARVHGYRLTKFNADVDGKPLGHGWSMFRDKDEARAAADAAVGQVTNRNMNAGGIPSGWCQRATVEEVPNPNYRPDCLGEIAVGDRYFEYMGNASPYQSGDRYCERCAVAVWVDLA